MTNSETYYNEADKHEGALEKVSGALRQVRDRAIPSAERRERGREMVRETARKSVDTARRHPVAVGVGALGVVLMAVGAVLLINPKTRRAGVDLAKRGIDRVRH